VTPAKLLPRKGCEVMKQSGKTTLEQGNTRIPEAIEATEKKVEKQP
jgi:hypothetical protein